jgi:predicted DNA-binding transcriptional regulator YafY
VVRPLGAFFWGRSWTLTAYCELRDDFRSFRIDRIRQLELLPDTFDPEPGKNLSDFLHRVGPRAAESLGL